MIYYAYDCDSDQDLFHFGILGMKWGVRRYQNPDGTLTAEGKVHYSVAKGAALGANVSMAGMIVPKNADCKNLSSFGKDADHNVCYIMGSSGSGKSTVAKNNSNSKTNVIHLDSYFDNPDGPKSREFNNFLASKGFDRKILYSAKVHGNDGAFWSKVDRFGDLVQEFGKDQYKKNKRVICEGVQMMDQTLYPDKTFFKGKPTIVLNTSSIVSTLRGHRRDGQRISYDDVKTLKLQRERLKNIKEALAKNTDVVFISGSSKTQDKKSGYYRKTLPKEVIKELKSYIKAMDTIIVGDAPGIDRQVQQFLNQYGYMNVEIYGPGTQVRYSANKKWKTNPINDLDHEPMSKEWLAKKDVAMTNAATKGLAIILDEGASATRKNATRLQDQHKDVKVYSINRKKKDSWVDTW